MDPAQHAQVRRSFETLLVHRRRYHRDRRKRAGAEGRRFIARGRARAANHDRGDERGMTEMQDQTSTGVTTDLMSSVETAAVDAAKEILTGRRIIDVEGPY